MMGSLGLQQVTRTDVFFLEFTSQVALDIEPDQHTIAQHNERLIRTLTKVVFPVPPSPTAYGCRMRWIKEGCRREC